MTGSLFSERGGEELSGRGKKSCVDFKACRLPLLLCKCIDGEDGGGWGCRKTLKEKKENSHSSLRLVSESAPRGVHHDNENLLYRGCCHLRVNYNYARFNLAPDRKQVLCPERYANATSGSFRSARGTKLFSGAPTNFLLIRTAHRAPLDNKRPTNVAFCGQIMGCVGKFSAESSQKASYRAFVSTREFRRSINELARPTDGFGMHGAPPGSEVIDSSEARWVI